MAPLLSLLAAHSGGRRLAALAAIVLGLAVVGTLAVHEAAPPKPEKREPLKPGPPPLQAADPSVSQVILEPPVVSVWAEVKNAPDLKGNVDKAQGIVGAVRRALVAGVSDNLDGVQMVRFHLRAEGQDRFGHDLMASLMTLDIDLGALKAARGEKLLGLAQTVTLDSPGAYDAVAAWCKDPARRDAAFCGKTSN